MSNFNEDEMGKKLTSIEFRCEVEFRAQVDALASSLNIDRSEFVRSAVAAEVKRQYLMWASLHAVFGDATNITSDSVGRDLK